MLNVTHINDLFMTLKGILIGALVAGGMIIAPGAAADGFTGQKTLGMSAGYNSFSGGGQIGLAFTYRFCKLLRLAPSMEYAFRHSHRDGLLINCNVQMPVPLARGISLYPQVGVNCSNWDQTVGVDTEGADVTSRYTRFGANFGGGIDIDMTRTLRLGVEGGYTLVRRCGGGQVVARIAFKF